METNAAGSRPTLLRTSEASALSSPTDFLPRDPDAAEYLSRKLGVKVSSAALEQRASRGTGPAFRIILGRAVYSRAALDQWAAAQLSPETPHSKRRRQAA